MINQLIIGLFLIIISVIDITSYKKIKGYIPSIITTTFLIISFVLFRNIFAAILALLIGLLFTDFNLWKGQADLKVFIGIGMTFITIQQIALFSALTPILAMFISMQTTDKEIPFIPVMAGAWLITLLLGGFI
jgi:drug/metabolite transporter (DMT)-like permease